MKVLVVDNDPGFLQTLARRLADGGHEVAAHGGINQLALAGIQSEGHELAIIDRRLTDDEDADDVSGEQLAIELSKCGVPSIMLTGYLPGNERVFQLVRSGAIAGVVFKGLPMSEFLFCVSDFTAGQTFANGLAKFALGDLPPEDTYASQMWRSLRDHAKLEICGEDIPYEEVALLFRKVASPCATMVKIELIPGGHSGAGVVKASVSFGDGPVTEQLAIKYGLKQGIRSEALRYDRHVGPLPDGAAALLRWRAETNHLGALAYSWVGDSVEDGEALKKVSWDRMRVVVRKLFSRSLDAWYVAYRSGECRPDGVQTLLAHYVGKGGLWYDDVRLLGNLVLPIDEDLHEGRITREDGQWRFGAFGVLHDPVHWLEHGPASVLRVDRLSPIHGDLHVRNVFVLTGDTPRLIDFGRTSVGHVFRDFAALETSIRLTIMAEATMAERQQVEDIVCSVTSLTEHVDYRALPRRSAARSAAQLAMDIRRCAADAAGSHLPEKALLQYFCSVALHMLRAAAGNADEVESGDEGSLLARRWHAMYGAARAASGARTFGD